MVEAPGGVWMGITWERLVRGDSPSGWLGVKLPWWWAVRGALTIEARRLDAPARPARAGVPDGYGEIGFPASGVLFPSPGCWEVTGRVGEADGFSATAEATQRGDSSPRSERNQYPRLIRRRSAADARRSGPARQYPNPVRR